MSATVHQPRQHSPQDEEEEEEEIPRHDLTSEIDAGDLPVNLDAPHPAFAQEGQEDLDEDALGEVGVILGEKNDGYEEKPICPIKLSYLERLYKDNNRLDAIELLRKRCRIQIDKKYIYKPLSRLYALSIASTRLDFLQLVSNDVGLSAAIPTIAGDPTFQFTIELRKHHVNFPLKHSNLGFDPTGCMLLFGTRNKEQTWLAWVPNSYLGSPDGENDSEVDEEDAMGRGQSGRAEGSGNTNLSPRHGRQVISFLVYCLAKLPRKPCDCFDPYGVNLDPSQSPQYHKLTSIMYVNLKP